jgi:hypothetical protein
MGWGESKVRAAAAICCFDSRKMSPPGGSGATVADIGEEGVGSLD